MGVGGAAACIAVVTATDGRAIAHGVLANSNTALDPEHRQMHRGGYVGPVDPLEGIGRDQVVDAR